MRYNFNWCVFKWPKNNTTDVSRACRQTCKPILKTMAGNLFTLPANKRFDYCSSDGTPFKDLTSSCVECLENTEDASVFANCMSPLPTAL